MKDSDATRIGSEVLKESVNEVGLDNTAVKTSKDSRFSYLTQTDEDLDRTIREKLDNRTGVPVLSEESDHTPAGDEYWIVDPIDGTIPFAHGVPNYVSMLAFVKDNRPIASAIYEPSTDQMFTATEDIAYLDDIEIQSLDKTTIHEEAVFNSVRADGDHESERFRRFHQKLTQDSIVFGSYCAGFGATRIATGDVVSGIYMALNEWDYMPTIRLVESSGGVVGSLKNGKTGIESMVNSDGDIACFASSEEVFDELFEVYQNS